MPGRWGGRARAGGACLCGDGQGSSRQDGLGPRGKPQGLRGVSGKAAAQGPGQLPLIPAGLRTPNQGDGKKGHQSQGGQGGGGDKARGVPGPRGTAVGLGWVAGMPRPGGGRPHPLPAPPAQPSSLPGLRGGGGPAEAGAPSVKAATPFPRCQENCLLLRSHSPKRKLSSCGLYRPPPPC